MGYPYEDCERLVSVGAAPVTDDAVRERTFRLMRVEARDG